MRKLLASAYKEVLLLIRDWGGLAILFIMPSVLIITITLIQESTFKAVGESRIPVVYVDEDQGEIGDIIQETIAENPSIQLIEEIDGKSIGKEHARSLVAEGTYQIAVVIPPGLSEELNTKVLQNVENILETLSMGESDSTASEPEAANWSAKEIDIFFDPAAGQTFRNSIKNHIEKLLANIETRKIYSVFQEQMGITDYPNILDQEVISFRETVAQKGNDGIIPNAVQHNVPAWILFGIFFIVVPLGINIVKEKNLGTYIRLRTSPVSYFVILLGKIATYTVICLIQFALMLLIARYVFPLLGLYAFIPGQHLPIMAVIALVAAWAAIGLGILIGTIAETQEQSAPFGAIFVIILAALGGVWVPTFIMPPMMQQISAFSPMNWGLSAFYEVILRNGTYANIAIPLLYLFLFFIGTLLLALFYDRRNRKT